MILWVRVGRDFSVYGLAFFIFRQTTRLGKISGINQRRLLHRGALSLGEFDKAVSSSVPPSIALDYHRKVHLAG
jgi:hypothetical protein